MSRASSAEDKPKKRAVRKRATSVKERASRKTTPRKKTTRRVSLNSSREKPVAEKRVDKIADEVGVPARKAPTPIAGKRKASRAKQKQLTVVVAILALGVGGSAAVGFIDQGKIDVNAAIEARNERINSGQAGESETQRVVVPVQNTAANQLPDGGLVGKGDAAPKPEPTPVPVATSSAATSTEAVATSTDAVEEVDVEDGEVDSGDDATIEGGSEDITFE